jgi:hypothetical protein
MNREEFKNKVYSLATESGISVAEAQKEIQEQYLNEGKRRRQREKEQLNEAANTLLSNPESKTVVIPIFELVPKEKAIAIAHSTIRVNKFHFLSQLVHGEKDTWLVASEFPISQANALEIMENLTADKYTHDEIEVIVTKHTPFDLR